MAVMLVAVTEGELGPGLEAQLARDEKIDELGLAWPKIGYEDLCLLRSPGAGRESAAREVLRRTGDEGVAVACSGLSTGTWPPWPLCPSRSSAETAQKKLSDWAICAEKDISIS
jgi:hypothetical protein